uniref:hypothetical protein n=1 Tax=Rhizobium bangladeshense TaxID=1138189 RepID=UPI001C83F9D4
IQPDRIRDDLLRETVALVADGRSLHPTVSILNSLTPRLCDNTPSRNGALESRHRRGCLIADPLRRRPLAA